MTTEVSVNKEDGIFVFGASNGESDYCLWQVEESGQNEIYFEHDDQINGGYNNIKECTIMKDGIHMVLDQGKLYHFYFSNLASEKYSELVAALESIYPPSILENQDK